MSLLLSVSHIQKIYAEDPVLDDVSFDIRTEEKVALIGPNGAGKTTLLKILMGQLEPDRGSVEFAKGIKFGFLAQRPEFDAGQTLWQVAERAIADLKGMQVEAERLSAQIAAATDLEQLAALSKRFDDLHHQIELRGGFELDYKIERVLHGLGFRDSDFERPARLLSGGEVNRLMLGMLLIEEPDLMLLDEPSNHLDIEATEWLEEFLTRSRQAYLLVSHDRYFLDRAVSRTLELVNGTIDDYPGNFTKYQTLKAQRLLVQQRTFEKQQTEIAKIEDFIRRNHYGQKAAQAEDRRKKLDRIERVALPRQITLPPMRFAEPSRTGDIVLRVEKLTKSFGGKVLFRDVSFQIERGQRWGILGPNGCGKSTLLNCLVGKESADAGQVVLGTGVRLGYFDQKLQSIDDRLPAYEAVRPPHKEMIDRERRDLLALFGVTGDLALQTVVSLSGGERNRVALARLAAYDANFLVLDEPTNHLDLWSREALEKALKAFEGTLLVVSHDRFFLNQICTHLLVFRPDRVLTIAGNFDTYRQLEQAKAVEDRERREGVRQGEKSRGSPMPSADNHQPARKRKYRYRKVADIEAEIATREADIERIHFELSNPEVLRQGPLVVALKQQLEEHQEQLAQLYDHWQEAIELNG